MKSRRKSKKNSPSSFLEELSGYMSSIGSVGGSVGGQSKSRGDSDYYRKLVNRRWKKKRQVE